MALCAISGALLWETPFTTSCIGILLRSVPVWKRFSAAGSYLGSVSVSQLSGLLILRIFYILFLDSHDCFSYVHREVTGTVPPKDNAF
jgi:hypothetical protein